MMHWFIWKNKSSLKDYGLWIRALPKIVRAHERHEMVEIPGRAGSLILKEGDEVYDSYLKELTIVTRNDNPKLLEAEDWLCDSGELIVSNEPDFIYDAHILDQVEFIRDGNSLLVATIPFWVEPLKRARQEDALTFTASGTVFNRGTVASKPIVSITATGDRTITIGGTSMTFDNLSGTVIVDCDAGMITKNGAIWTEEVTGDFWRIPTGTSAVMLPASTSVTIEPRWRWR